MEEIWKDIVGYEGLYKVSNLGRVKSISRKIKTRWKTKRKTNDLILKHTHNHKGYCLVVLSKNNKAKIFQIHRLVAIAFIPNIMNKPQVNHKDGNKTNNSVDNLEWTTPHENMKHAYDNNLITREEINKCIKKSIEKISKPIFQIKNGNIVNEFESIEKAKKYLNVKSSGSIVNVLKNRSKSAFGYQWKYKEKGN